MGKAFAYLRITNYELRFGMLARHRRGKCNAKALVVGNHGGVL